MARIYIGRTTGIGSFERHVVLKVILPERANDYTAVQMFLDEARLAASLNHQNVAQVFEVGEDSGIHFLAMEYVHGQDLRALLAKAGSEGTRVPLELALTVVAGAAAGLEHAHERRTSDGVPMGIVHRDVSPSNIMIGYDGAVKLLDFGIAKATSRSVETQSGIIKGKFAYMAPEQCRGREVDRRSDVFSIGIILYEVTTQHRCFRADSDFDTMHRIVTGDVVRPTRLVQGYPQALEAIIMKALAVDTHQRYQTAGLLLEAIESFAIAARMSLSTMSLGRFMRDMFGDVQEPWLMAGRGSQPPQLKEHTISNTNASGGRSQPHRPASPPLSHHEEAPLHLSPESEVDIPLGGEPHVHDHRPQSDAAAAGWQAAGYPPMPPVYASAAALPQDGRRSPPYLPPEGHQPSSNLLPMPLEVPSQVGLASGTPQVLPPQFATQTGSGPAHGALAPGVQPIAKTRQGYTGAPGLGQSESSYPSYDPSHDPEDNLDLQSSHRLLFVGLGVVLIFIIVVLVMLISDSGSDDLPSPPPRPTSSINSGTEPGSGERKLEPTNPEALEPVAVRPEPFKPDAAVPANGPAVETAAVHEESISIRVVSVPPGADVLFAGKPIGTTPLETKIKRSTGYGTLTVHRAKFEDVTTTIDLSSDYHRELALTPIPDEPVARPILNRPTGGHDRSGSDRSGNDRSGNDRSGNDRSGSDRSGNDRSGNERSGNERNLRDVRHPAPPPPPPPPPPAAKKCQPPDKLNPFDTSCGGQACPPCK